MRLRSIVSVPADGTGFEQALGSAADAILMTVADSRVPAVDNGRAPGRLRLIAESGKAPLVMVAIPARGSSGTTWRPSSSRASRASSSRIPSSHRMCATWVRSSASSSLPGASSRGPWPFSPLSTPLAGCSAPRRLSMPRPAWVGSSSPPSTTPTTWALATRSPAPACRTHAARWWPPREPSGCYRSCRLAPFNCARWRSTDLPEQSSRSPALPRPQTPRSPPLPSTSSARSLLSVPTMPLARRAPGWSASARSHRRPEARKARQALELQ
jgi:hypothetical protein